MDLLARYFAFSGWTIEKTDQATPLVAWENMIMSVFLTTIFRTQHRTNVWNHFDLRWKRGIEEFSPLAEASLKFTFKRLGTSIRGIAVFLLWACWLKPESKLTIINVFHRHVKSRILPEFLLPLGSSRCWIQCTCSLLRCWCDLLQCILLLGIKSAGNGTSEASNHLFMCFSEVSSLSFQWKVLVWCPDVAWWTQEHACPKLGSTVWVCSNTCAHYFWKVSLESDRK